MVVCRSAFQVTCDGMNASIASGACADQIYKAGSILGLPVRLLRLGRSAGRGGIPRWCAESNFELVLARTIYSVFVPQFDSSESIWKQQEEPVDRKGTGCRGIEPGETSAVGPFGRCIEHRSQ